MTQINNANNIFGAKNQHKVPENPKEALVSTQKSPSVDKVELSPQQSSPATRLLKDELTQYDIDVLLNNISFLEGVDWSKYAVPDEYVNTNNYHVLQTFGTFETVYRNVENIFRNLDTLGRTSKVKADSIFYMMDKAAIQIMPSMIQYLQKQVRPEEEDRLQHAKQTLAANQVTLKKLCPNGVNPQVAALPGPIKATLDEIEKNKASIASEEEAIASTKEAIATLEEQLLDLYNQSVLTSSGGSKVATLQTEYQTVLKSLGLL